MFVCAVGFLNAGDTFSGSIHFDSCSDVEDHPGVIIIRESAGNAVTASIFSKVDGQVREYSAKGFFYVPDRKLILVPEGADAKSLGMVCTFAGGDESANCQLMRDTFSRKCGTFQMTRDFVGEYSASTMTYDNSGKQANALD